MNIPTTDSCAMSVVSPVMDHPAETSEEETEASIDQVEHNVIDTGFNREPSPLPTSSSSSRPMPSIENLSFHSPSSQIIGTPFDTKSTPFEYPFPDTSDPDSPSSPVSPPFASLTSGASTSRLAALLPCIPAPALTLPDYSTTHPKMRVTNPPVPPSLVKKRHRWSVSLKSRRKNSPVAITVQQQQPPNTAPKRSGSFEATQHQMLEPAPPSSPPIG